MPHTSVSFRLKPLAIPRDILFERECVHAYTHVTPYSVLYVWRTDFPCGRGIMKASHPRNAKLM